MTVVRPYGDTTGDGRIQLSFTLPVPFGDATERARASGSVRARSPGSLPTGRLATTTLTSCLRSHS